MEPRRTSSPGGPAAAPMLRRARDLQGYAIGAADGDIGDVRDFLFDDRSWTVRHIVVDTGRWLPGRRVLISPLAIRRIDPVGLRLVTDLTRDKVEHSPDVDADRPVSRQMEARLAEYYGHPFYWVGPYRWGPVAAPTADPAAYVPPRGGTVPPPEARETDDPHLRSTGEVAGYALQATDGRLGHVVDFLVEEESWAIRYLIVDPRSWWPGKHVLIATEWLTGVSWDRSEVAVDLSREQVRNAPEYDPAGHIDREWETRLFAAYGRPPYWDRRPEAWQLYPPAA